MTTVTISNDIEAPVEQVFGLFADIERAAQYVSGIKRVEMLTQGPFGLRTRWRETRQVLGHLDSAEMEVTAFERNRSYTITHFKGGARIDTVFSFEPSGDGTKASIKFNLDSHGLPAGLLSPLGWAIAGTVRDVIGKDLADLKALAERDRKPPA